MKYYLHDTNAFQDEKVTELFIKFGYEGIGLFYTILEKLALQEKPVKTAILKKQLFVGKRLNKCWLFMEEIGIISSNNGETFNKQLLKFSEKYQIKKEKNAKRIFDWRKNQADSENVTHYEHVRNTPKVKKSKEKESNIKEIYKTTLLSNLTKSDFIDSKYFDVTMSFYEVFKKNLIEAGASTSTLEKAKGTWIDHIRHIYETDKHSSEAVQKVFKHLQIAEFWKKNILSTSKLREKFNQLLIEIKSKGNESNKQNKETTGATPEQVAQILSRKFAEKRNSL